MSCFLTSCVFVVPATCYSILALCSVYLFLVVSLLIGTLFVVIIIISLLVWYFYVIMSRKRITDSEVNRQLLSDCRVVATTTIWHRQICRGLDLFSDTDQDPIYDPMEQHRQSRGQDYKSGIQRSRTIGHTHVGNVAMDFVFPNLSTNKPKCYYTKWPKTTYTVT